MESQVRILWLTPDKPANISVGRSQIAEHLQDDGYRVTINETTLQSALKHLRDWDIYDIVIGTTRAGAIVGTVLSRVYNVPLLVDHVDPIDQFRETASAPVATVVDWFERITFREAQRVLYIYPEERERVESYARAATKTNLGVDFDRFASPQPEQIEAARDKVDIEDEPIAVYVGGLESIYNIQTVLDAFEYLSGWTLVVAGDGTLREEVERAANVHDRIVYLGTIPHETVPGLLSLSDVGISLVDDPHTLKVLEYGAAGLPTVQLGGRAEKALGDAVTYCRLDPNSVATALKTAVDADPSALRNIAKQRNWHQIAEQYQNAIDEAVEK